jgi:hypothetical protein
MDWLQRAIVDDLTAPPVLIGAAAVLVAAVAVVVGMLRGKTFVDKRDGI